MRKRLLVCGIVLLGIAICLEVMQVVASILAMLKYGCAAYGIVCISHATVLPYIHQKHFLIAAIAKLILCVYTILLVDTFLFHALYWFPGILRYPLFSAYVPGYLLFILPGIALAYDPKEKDGH